MKRILFIFRLSLVLIFSFGVIHLGYEKIMIPHLDFLSRHKNILIFVFGVLPVELIFFTFLRKNPTLINALTIVLAATIITQAYIYFYSNLEARPFLKSYAVENGHYFFSSGTLSVFFIFLVLMIPPFVGLRLKQRSKR